MCNMVGFVFRFISVARLVSRKVEPLSSSATVATIAAVRKRRVSPCNITYGKWSPSGCYATLRMPIRKRNKRPKQNGRRKQDFETTVNVLGQEPSFYVYGATPYDIFSAGIIQVTKMPMIIFSLNHMLLSKGCESFAQSSY